MRYLWVIFSLWIACTSLSCAKAPSAPSVPIFPTMEVYGFTARSYKTGKPDWTLNGRKADLFFDKDKKDSKLVLYDFTMTNFSEKADGDQSKETDKAPVDSIISANRGVFFEKARDANLYGNVNIENNDGTIVSSETITYKDRANEITTSDWVTLRRKNGDWLNGRGMIADKDLTNVRILQNVSGKRIHVRDDRILDRHE